MKRQKTWALVMNSVQARIVRGLEAADDAAPASVERTSGAGETHMRDHLDDRAGRSFSSGAAGRRAAMEPGSDPVRRDMEEFAKETLRFLGERHAARDFERIAVVATPKMIGILRRQITSELRDALILEHTANLVALPEDELRRTLKSMVFALPPGG